MKEHLFVYGTLRRGGGHDLEKMIPDAAFLEEAQFRGKMALVDYFPGVIDSENGTDQVHGEVYALDGDGKSLQVLDDFEDYRPDSPSAGVYLREKREVVGKSGEVRLVWIYIYNRPWEHFPKIGSGDYIRFLKESGTASME